MHLDFVYGSKKNNVFIPLDGQQRLTTLFLMHWYLGLKYGHDIRYLGVVPFHTKLLSRIFACVEAMRAPFLTIISYPGLVMVKSPVIV